MGEVLWCEQEHNTEDQFAVAVKRQDSSGTTVGHLPREFQNLHVTCLCLCVFLFVMDLWVFLFFL